MKSTRFLVFSLLAAAALAAPSRAAVETYTIDTVHSSVGFTISHLVSKVPGSFTKFSGTLTVDRDNLEKSSVTATIEVGSINTASDMRDNDLRTPSYFDAAKYPTMTFTSTAWKKGADKDTYEISGNLTLHGVTKPVVLKAKLLGFADGMQPGSKVTGWEATAALNRKDFGIVGGMGADAILGNEVAVTINIEADLKK